MSKLRLGFAVSNRETQKFLYGNKNIVRMADDDKNHVIIFVFRHEPRYNNGPGNIYYYDPRISGYEVPPEMLRLVCDEALK